MTEILEREVMSFSRALAALGRRMHGELLTPDAPGYHTARRIVNARIDRHPAVIARCRNAQDVAHAVRFAREQGLEIAVRSGGHSAVGHSVGDGGLMIDLSAMKQTVIDPVRQTARVEPGVNNGELVHATAAYGLATTTGTCATVGMGGSTVGGGIGWLMGRFGATVDNLLACEVVTADGQIRTASAGEHPDLFWALRGGGGNFGVVTAFTYRLHRLETVLGGMLIFPLAVAGPVLRLFRDVTSHAPDELIGHAVMTTIPNFGPALVIEAVYAGEQPAVGEQLLAPLRRSGPAVDRIAVRSYADTYMLLTPPMPPGTRLHDSAYALRAPSDLALDEIVACAAERPSPMSLINIHQIHGAATRVPAGATAFALRVPHYAVVNFGMWQEGDGHAEAVWVEQTRVRMECFASPELYVNFLGSAGADAVRASYGDNYVRLATIKARYDPDNLFHRNQNIRPC